MRRALALAALLAGGVAAWFYLRRPAAAAPAPPSPPVPTWQAPAVSPGRYLTAAQCLDIIAQLDAAEFGGWFDIYDVMAVIQNEAARGPGGTYDAHSHGDRSLSDGGSYGLMQVRASTAAGLGFTGSPVEMFDPVVGIRMGMRTLKANWDYMTSRRPGEFDKGAWIGAYNAGVGNWERGYTPLEYVASWRRNRAGWP